MRQVKRDYIIFLSPVMFLRHTNTPVMFGDAL